MSKAQVTFPSAPDTSAIDIEDEGSLIVSNPTAMNFTGPGVTVTENPTGTAEVDIPGLQYWTESEDATTQQSTIFTPNNVATDVNAVLLPKGNGANTAQTPDGTTAGGNARGAYATDWQKRRLNANQVASGAESVICGGLDNRASGNQSFVGGGVGNTASGGESFVGGGDRNTASGTNATVVGGIENTASGNYSIAGGQNCNATRDLGCVAFGATATATNRASFSIGRSVANSGENSTAFGYGNTNQSLFANIAGTGGVAKNKSSNIFAQGYNDSGSPSGNSGNYQEGYMLTGFSSRRSTPIDTKASGALVYLWPGLGLNNGPTWAWLPAKDNQFFTFQLKIHALVVAISGTATGVNVGDIKQFNFEGSGKVVSGTVTILNAGTTPTVLYEDSGLATMSAQFIVGSAAQSVGIEVTNATFSGGGELDLKIVGHLYWQESTL